MGNYKIVTDEYELQRFINILPDLTPDEKYYVTLFARKKYSDDTRFKADKTQLKRLIVNKQDLIIELKKLEVAIGLYMFDGIVIPPDMLAVYINPNPRSMSKASLEMLSKMADNLKKGQPLRNPKSEAMNCIQVTPSHKQFFDIDIDAKPNERVEATDIFKWITDNEIINFDCIKMIKTRGGFHLLINTSLIQDAYVKRWYQGFTRIYVQDLGFDVMMNSDNLIPIPGCTQGGYTPKLLTY